MGRSLVSAGHDGPSSEQPGFLRMQPTRVLLVGLVKERAILQVTSHTRRTATRAETTDYS